MSDIKLVGLAGGRGVEGNSEAPASAVVPVSRKQSGVALIDIRVGLERMAITHLQRSLDLYREAQTARDEGDEGGYFMLHGCAADAAEISRAASAELAGL